MCMVCSKELAWYELVPIVSFLVQHGRCRECHSRISEQYVIVELITAALFALAGALLWSGDYSTITFVMLALDLLIISVLVSISVYDYFHQIIPDSFVITLIGIGVLKALVNVLANGQPASLFLEVLVGALVLFLPFYILWAVSKGKWIGLGDGKLAFAMGMILPFAYAVSAVVLAFWVGALFGIVYLYINKMKNGGSNHQIPFGPFLVLGTLIVMFFPIDLFSLVELTQYARELF